MSNFKDALDKVIAEQELKQSTKDFINNKLAKQQSSESLYINRRINMKKYIIAACTIALVGLTLGGYQFYKTPVNYISLDINPSVELGVNALDVVVSATAINEDGQTILENQDVLNTDVETAIDTLVQSADENEFIQPDGSTVIAITAESDNPDAAVELQDKCEVAANGAIQERKKVATIYKDCSDLSLRTEAKELGISPGKYKLIKALEEVDPTVTVEAYKDLKVSEIMQHAKGIDVKRAEHKGQKPAPTASGEVTATDSLAPDTTPATTDTASTTVLQKMQQAAVKADQQKQDVIARNEKNTDAQRTDVKPSKMPSESTRPTDRIEPSETAHVEPSNIPKPTDRVNDRTNTNSTKQERVRDYKTSVAPVETISTTANV